MACHYYYSLVDHVEKEISTRTACSYNTNNFSVNTTSESYLSQKCAWRDLSGHLRHGLGHSWAKPVWQCLLWSVCHVLSLLRTPLSPLPLLSGRPACRTRSLSCCSLAKGVIMVMASLIDRVNRCSPLNEMKLQPSIGFVTLPPEQKRLRPAASKGDGYWMFTGCAVCSSAADTKGLIASF